MVGCSVWWLGVWWLGGVVRDGGENGLILFFDNITIYTFYLFICLSITNQGRVLRVVLVHCTYSAQELGDSTAKHMVVGLQAGAVSD